MARLIEWAPAGEVLAPQLFDFSSELLQLPVKGYATGAVTVPADNIRISPFGGAIDLYRIRRHAPALGAA
jgi:hypothetical protein